MDLQTFVRDVLPQVFAGIEEAQDQLLESRPDADPQRPSINPPQNWKVQDMKFDVALVVNDESTTSGKADGKLSIPFANVGIAGEGSLERKSGEQTTSRVTFTVPVAFRRRN